MKITKEQYEFALQRIEELHPLIDDNTPANDKVAIEFSVIAEIVIAYEEEHFPIGTPTVAELIGLSIEEKEKCLSAITLSVGFVQKVRSVQYRRDH